MEAAFTSFPWNAVIAYAILLAVIVGAGILIGRCRLRRKDRRQVES
jgi:hypothetical protein